MLKGTADLKLFSAIVEMAGHNGAFPAEQLAADAFAPGAKKPDIARTAFGSCRRYDYLYGYRDQAAALLTASGGDIDDAYRLFALAIGARTGGRYLPRHAGRLSPDLPCSS